DRDVDVLHRADRAEEVGEVVALGEGGELGRVVEPHVDDPLCSRGREPAEEVLRRRLGEPDREDLHGTSLPANRPTGSPYAPATAEGPASRHAPGRGGRDREGAMRWRCIPGRHHGGKEGYRHGHHHSGSGGRSSPRPSGQRRSVLADRRQVLTMALRMDNVGIVVESLDAAIEFFGALGLELEGRGLVEGEWAGRVTGLGDQRVEIAMMRTPDGHGRLELSRFIEPPVVADHRSAPVNALGYLRVMFAVDDIDATLERLRKRGAELVGDVVQYQDTYRLCYIRGPEGILIGLAQELG